MISPTFIEISIMMQYRCMILSIEIVLSWRVGIMFFFINTNQTLAFMFKLNGKSWYFPVGILSQLVLGQVTFSKASCKSRILGFLKITCPISLKGFHCSIPKTSLELNNPSLCDVDASCGYSDTGPSKGTISVSLSDGLAVVGASFFRDFWTVFSAFVEKK